METLESRRRGPFIVMAAIFIAVCLTVIALPDSLVASLERNRPLTDIQAGWAYRLLVLFAVAQIVYTGGSVFRIERVAEARERDPRMARMPKADVISSLSRNAAALVVFTLIYGSASIVLTGQRGGFWLFPLLALGQAGWYYREIGQIAAWKTFQPEHVEADPDGGRWRREPDDYCPPLARGLVAVSSHDPTTDTTR